jgi:hypothetical protein
LLATEYSPFGIKILFFSHIRKKVIDSLVEGALFLGRTLYSRKLTVLCNFEFKGAVFEIKYFDWTLNF